MTKTIFKHLMLILLLVLSKNFLSLLSILSLEKYLVYILRVMPPYLILGVFVGSSMDMEI